MNLKVEMAIDNFALVEHKPYIKPVYLTPSALGM